jgi:transcription elongation factor GreA
VLLVIINSNLKQRAIREKRTRCFDRISPMTNAAYLTPEGLEKLKAELDDMKKRQRPEGISRLETAKQLGDLSENAEYHEAKDALAFIESRIRELEDTLHNAVVIEDTKKSGAVEVGSTIMVESNGREKTYQIVGSSEADPAGGRISNESPIGAAFLGKKKGDVVPVETPGGTVTYTIVEVK